MGQRNNYMIDNDIAYEVLKRQFGWYRNEHSYVFVWNDYNPGQKNRYILEAIALYCYELGRHDEDFRVFITNFFLNAYDRYSKTSAAAHLEHEIFISRTKILNNIRNNYNQLHEFAKFAFEQERNYVEYVLEPMLEEKLTFFNKKMIGELKRAGMTVPKNAQGPFMPLGKMCLRMEDKYSMVYPIAIFSDDDQRVLSILLTYNSDEILIESTVNLLKIDYLEQTLRDYPEAAFVMSDYSPIMTNSYEWQVEVNRKNTFNLSEVAEDDLNRSTIQQMLSDCLEKWKDGLAVFEGVILYHKIAYLYGRLNEFSSFENFVKSKVEMTIGLMADEVELKIGIDLYFIGLSYPNLNDEQFATLEGLYQNGLYFETLDYLLFDQDLLPRKLKKYDLQKQEIYNSEFPDNLLMQTFETFLQQGDDDFEFQSFSVYDRPTNSIVTIKNNSELDYRTQKIIDFGFNLENKDFIKLVTEFFGVDLATRFVEFFTETDDMDLIEDLGDYAANHYTFQRFDEFLSEEIYTNNKLNVVYLDFKRVISRLWLEYANKPRRKL